MALLGEGVVMSLQSPSNKILQGFYKSLQGFGSAGSCFFIVSAFGETGNFLGINPSTAHTGRYPSTGIYDDIVYAVFSDKIYGISSIDGTQYCVINFASDFPSSTLRSACVDSTGVYLFHDEAAGASPVVYTLKMTKYPLSGGTYISTNDYLVTDDTQTEWGTGEESPFIRKSLIYDGDAYALLPKNRVAVFGLSSLSLTSTIALPDDSTQSNSSSPALTNMARFDISDDKIYVTWRQGATSTSYKTKLTISDMSGTLEYQDYLIDRALDVSGFERGNEITIHDGHMVLTGGSAVNKRSLSTKEIVCSASYSVDMRQLQPDLNPPSITLFISDFHAAKSDGDFLYSCLAYSQTPTVYGTTIGKVTS